MLHLLVQIHKAHQVGALKTNKPLCGLFIVVVGSLLAGVVVSNMAIALFSLSDGAKQLEL